MRPEYEYWDLLRADMKNIWSSKTVWVNLLTFIVAAGELTQVIDLFNDEQLKIVLAVLALANLALRLFFTDMGIKQTR